MLRTEPMQKLRLLFLESDKAHVMRFLHKEGIIDLRKSKAGTMDDAPDEILHRYSEALVKVDGALSLLKKREIKKEKVDQERILELVDKQKEIERIYEISKEKKDISDEIAGIKAAEEIASYFDSIDVDFSHLKSSVLVFRAFLVQRKELGKLERRLKELGDNIKIVTRNVTGKQAKGKALLFIVYISGTQADDKLKGFRVSELDLSNKYLSGTPAQTLKLAEEKRRGVNVREAALDRELDELGAKVYSRLACYKEELQILIDRENAKTYFKKTEKTFVVEGWIPKKKLAEFKARLAQETSNRYEMVVLEEDELAPTLMNRPKIFKPFDYLMEFYSLPRSDEIDPTWIFIISFPIFYGLMLSDVGYGIASLLLATWFTTFTNPDGLVYNVSKIWQMCAISAIFFGFLSNQYFGFHLNQYFTTFTGFDWFKNVNQLLVLVILFGLVQVSLGLAFSFVNHYREKKYKLAASKLLGIITIITGSLAVAGGFFYALPAGPSEAFGIIAVVSLIATGALSGIEASELTNLITHPLSYARIFGFGLASVIIAMLIDQGFTPTLAHGILVFIVLLIVFIALHTLNLIMGIFEGVVQGVRLNFVEFFSKFYRGGGIKFKPFAFKRVYTKEE